MSVIDTLVVHPGDTVVVTVEAENNTPELLQQLGRSFRNNKVRVVVVPTCMNISITTEPTCSDYDRAMKSI